MRRNTAALLVIIAALLAVDIALRVSPREAVAQDQFEFEFEAARTPHVIQVETSSPPSQHHSRVFRLWSDGVIEDTAFDSISMLSIRVRSRASRRDRLRSQIISTTVRPMCRL